MRKYLFKNIVHKQCEMKNQVKFAINLSRNKVRNVSCIQKSYLKKNGTALKCVSGYQWLWTLLTFWLTADISVYIRSIYPYDDSFIGKKMPNLQNCRLLWSVPNKLWMNCYELTWQVCYHSHSQDQYICLWLLSFFKICLLLPTGKS